MRTGIGSRHDSSLAMQRRDSQTRRQTQHPEMMVATAPPLASQHGLTLTSTSFGRIRIVPESFPAT